MKGSQAEQLSPEGAQRTGRWQRELHFSPLSARPSLLRRGEGEEIMRKQETRQLLTFVDHLEKCRKMAEGVRG